MIKINVIGLDQLEARFKTLPKEIQMMVSTSLQDGAQTFVRNAKRDAPVNFGVLRNEISYFKNNDLNFTVVSGANYSPYLEWGTITHVSVPGELTAYASEFKGRGIRKNGGIYPRPFFFRQTPVVEEQINNDLKKINEIKL